MSTQPALLNAENAEGAEILGGRTPTGGSGRRIGHPSWATTLVLALCSLSVLIPLYVTVSMAFKTTE